MFFLLVGIGLLLLKFYDVGLVSQWSWWWILSPFAMAAIWWTLADSLGFTRRKEMQKMDARKKSRVERQKASLGMGKKGR